jgi:hypothetical protein
VTLAVTTKATTHVTDHGLSSLSRNVSANAAVIEVATFLGVSGRLAGRGGKD